MSPVKRTSPPGDLLDARRFERLRQQYLTNYIRTSGDVDFPLLSEHSLSSVGVKLSVAQIRRIAEDNGWLDQARHAESLVQSQVATALRDSQVVPKKKAIEEDLRLAGFTKKMGAAFLNLAFEGFQRLTSEKKIKVETIRDVSDLVTLGERMARAGLQAELQLYSENEALILREEGGGGPQALNVKHLGDLSPDRLELLLMAIAEVTNTALPERLKEDIQNAHASQDPEGDQDDSDFGEDDIDPEEDVRLAARRRLLGAD